MVSRERERSRSRIRSRVVIAVLIATALTLSFLGAIMITLYTYPGVSWSAIINAKEANPSVSMVTIINPDNGPGASQDQNYVNGINNLRAAGIVVLGYDHTSWANRPIADVEADINSYKSWYNLSGIFFDEMSNVPGDEGYYSTLNQYAKSMGLNFTVGNPGGPAPASYLGTLDVIVTYENQGLPDSTSLAQMTNGVPPNHFAVIAYGVNVWNGSAVSALYNYASYVYVTNETLPNPYGALTGDFSKMVSLLSNPNPTLVHLTVQSVNAAGTPIAGVYTTITSANGSPVASGNTPLTAPVTKGVGYFVSVANYGSFVFEHWDDGSTGATQAVTAAGTTTLTATYMTAVQTTSTSTTSTSTASPSTTSITATATSSISPTTSPTTTTSTTSPTTSTTSSGTSTTSISTSTESPTTSTLSTTSASTTSVASGSSTRSTISSASSSAVVSSPSTVTASSFTSSTSSASYSITGYSAPSSALPFELAAVVVVIAVMTFATVLIQRKRA